MDLVRCGVRCALIVKYGALCLMVSGSSTQTTPSMMRVGIAGAAVRPRRWPTSYWQACPVTLTVPQTRPVWSETVGIGSADEVLANGCCFGLGRLTLLPVLLMAMATSR